jgi:hypothetical protein
MKSFLLLPVAALFGSAAPSSNLVQVVGTDYAFTAPATVPAGRTTLVFKNAGKHSHEFNIFLLKKGSTIDDFLKLRRADKPQMGVVVEAPVGVIFADPATTGAARLTTDLLPNREYGVICIFRDSAGKPPHYDLGMYKVIRTSGTVAVKPTAQKVDSVVGVDYAYSKYPREISPGIHTIAFRNDGKHRHEFNIGLLNKGVTLDSVLAVDKRGGDVNRLFDPTGPGAVLYSDAGKSPLANVTMEFLPGREYLIECAFQDDAKSPEHYKLGMYGSIKARMH